MRVTGFHPWMAPAGVMLAVVAAAGALFVMSWATRAMIGTTGCPPATPGSSPCPSSAYLNIDPTTGGPTTAVNVHGRQFLPNEAINLYWDSPGKVAGTATTNASGGFDQTYMPFPGDSPGKHLICTTEAPQPCATFVLQAPPSPSPSASPSPSDSPTPTASASPTSTESPTPSPAALAPINGIDIITRPPFVFLPVIALLALIGLLAYWALGGNQRSRPQTLSSASVVHRTARPDYLKTLERPAPPGDQPLPLEPPPPAGEPPPQPEPPPQAAPPPPDWPSTYEATGVEPPPHQLPEAPDAPPDLPEPGD